MLAVAPVDTLMVVTVGLVPTSPLMALVSTIIIVAALAAYLLHQMLRVAQVSPFFYFSEDARNLRNRGSAATTSPAAPVKDSQYHPYEAPPRPLWIRTVFAVASLGLFLAMWGFALALFNQQRSPDLRLQDRLQKTMRDSTQDDTSAYDLAFIADGVQYLAVTDAELCAATSFPLASGESSYYALDEPCTRDALLAASGTEALPLEGSPGFTVFMTVLLLVQAAMTVMLVADAFRSRYAKAHYWPIRREQVDYTWLDPSPSFVSELRLNAAVSTRQELMPQDTDDPGTIDALADLRELFIPPSLISLPSFWRTHRSLSAITLFALAAAAVSTFATLMGVLPPLVWAVSVLTVIASGLSAPEASVDDYMYRYDAQVQQMPDHVARITRKLTSGESWQYNLWFATLHRYGLRPHDVTPASLVSAFETVEPMVLLARNLLHKAPQSADYEYEMVCGTLPGVVMGSADKEMWVRDLISTLEFLIAPNEMVRTQQ